MKQIGVNREMIARGKTRLLIASFRERFVLHQAASSCTGGRFGVLEPDEWETKVTLMVSGFRRALDCGAHVANCGYVTAAAAQGRGVARMMCEHSIKRAKERAFRAMRFNFVVATNENAVRLWQSCGLAIVGRLPDVFLHPRLGYVDALVMYRLL